MASRTLVIGDIHGCARALDAVLNELQPTPDDQLILLGDYIDRGDESRQVLDRLIKLESECQLTPLLGNHELMMIRAYEDYSQAHFWLSCGGEQTLASYGGSPGDVPEEHHAFLKRCLRFFETQDHLFVHANYRPDMELRDQPEELLFWAHLTYFVPKPHKSGKRAIVGHTPQRNGEVLDLDHLVCIDTYCVGDGWLTAMDVHSGQFWQASKRGEIRPTRAAKP